MSFRRVPARQPWAGVETVKLGSRSWAFVATPLRLDSWSADLFLHQVERMASYLAV